MNGQFPSWERTCSLRGCWGLLVANLQPSEIEQDGEGYRDRKTTKSNHQIIQYKGLYLNRLTSSGPIWEQETPIVDSYCRMVVLPMVCTRNSPPFRRSPEWTGCLASCSWIRRSPSAANLMIVKVVWEGRRGRQAGPVPGEGPL